MKKLIVSATTKEVFPLLEKAAKKSDYLFSLTKEVDILITGIGAFQTIYQLMKHLGENNYKQLINVGIAGSFLPSLDIGTVVEVNQDIFADFGVDDNGRFVPACEADLLETNTFPFKYGWLKNPQIFDSNLPQIKGITVQVTSGSITAITQRQNLFSPDIETMESAAIFYVALRKQIPFVVIRAISNKVEPRNKLNWNIDLAIGNLNHYLESVYKVR